jgi:hypothetical protein
VPVQGIFEKSIFRAEIPIHYLKRRLSQGFAFSCHVNVTSLVDLTPPPSPRPQASDGNGARSREVRAMQKPSCEGFLQPEANG